MFRVLRDGKSSFVIQFSYQTRYHTIHGEKYRKYILDNYGSFEAYFRVIYNYEEEDHE